jgi:hypothetical protein
LIQRHKRSVDSERLKQPAAGIVAARGVIPS